MDGAKAFATSSDLPEKGAEPMAPTEPLSEDVSPGIREARFGWKIGQAAGDFTAESAMIAIARGRLHDVFGLCAVLRSRFSHQDSHFSENLAAFSQQSQSVGSLDAQGASAPAPLHLEPAQIAKEESHGKIGVADLPADGATSRGSEIGPEMMRRIGSDHGCADWLGVRQSRSLIGASEMFHKVGIPSRRPLHQDVGYGSPTPTSGPCRPVGRRLCGTFWTRFHRQSRHTPHHTEVSILFSRGWLCSFWGKVLLFELTQSRGERRETATRSTFAAPRLFAGMKQAILSECKN
jgi:hypothetical protein